MILILSNKWDVTVDFVIKELQKRDYPYLRINTEDISELAVTTELPDLSIIVEWRGQSVDLTEEIGAVWYRRPKKPFELDEEENQPDAATINHIQEQWGAWWESLQTIPDITWVNHPVENHRMESKTRQLHLAEQIGFEIPETQITNNPSTIQNLYQEFGSLISKVVSTPPPMKGDQDKFVYTVLLNASPLNESESLEVCPSIFQEPLVPKTDYRVTVIEEMVLPVKVEGKGQESVPVDWRTEKENIRFVPADLPDRIKCRCRNYVDEAGLLFGAIDIVEHNGEYVFLEINPNGEWGWLQKPWGIPIAEEIAKLLIKHDNESK